MRIKLVSGTGVTTGTVDVVRVVDRGFHPTHNGDGRFRKKYAVDAGGTYYETKPKGGGWRRSKDQKTVARVVAKTTIYERAGTR